VEAALMYAKKRTDDAKVNGTFHGYAIATDNTWAAKLKHDNVNEKCALISKLVCRRRFVRMRNEMNLFSRQYY
jgi:hypothetical protein